MRKGFFNGLFTGGLMAAVFMIFAAPQFKKERTKLMKDTKQARNRARRVVRGVKNVAEDWMK